MKSYLSGLLFGCGVVVFLIVYALWCLAVVEAAVWYAERFIL